MSIEIEPTHEFTPEQPTVYDQLLHIREMVESTSPEDVRVVSVPVITEDIAQELQIGTLDPEVEQPPIYFRIGDAWLRAKSDGSLDIHHRREMAFLPLTSDEEVQAYQALLEHTHVPQSA